MNRIWPWQDSPSPNDPHVWLRVLETTDVHANILPFDYFAGRDETHYGLARTATLIRAARQEAANCLLFDNGDFLQGTPLSDITARPESGWQGKHPVIEVMNGLRYDAANLGNHEFNFGLEALKRALVEAHFPTLCANAATRLADDPAQDDTFLPARVILKRTVTDNTGRRHRLRVGVIGLLPPQVTTWDQFHLRGRLNSRDIIEAARAHVPRLRANGADVVIALAHTGIDPGGWVSGMENAALALAAVPGIDAILAGHSHEIFPDPALETTPGINHKTGTLGGVPAVMAGHRGSHLGVLDLCLTAAEGRGWRVHAHRSEVRPVSVYPSKPPVEPDPEVSATVSAAHKATLRMTRRAVSKTDIALHSYLSQVRPDAAVRIAAAAQAWALSKQIADQPEAELPILSASAPFKCGGRAGPLHYTDIRAGALTIRNIVDLYPFPNTLCALRLTGAEVLDWLERAASCFHQLVPGQTRQPLWNSAFPSHAFDTITGLHYDIDLTLPPSYDERGRALDPGTFRVTNVSHAGRPLDPAAAYVVATNNYRGFGGGPYAHPRPDALIYASRTLVRDLIAHYLRSHEITQDSLAPNWRLRKMVMPTTALLTTGPGLRRHPEDVRRFGLSDLGDTEEGFARFEMPL